MQPDRLPRPPAFDDDRGPVMWVDEAIWGHRLHDEQTPWLAFLEFLTVYHSEDSEGRAFHEPDLNTLRYKPARHLQLRNVLFNNPRMVSIQRSQPDDDSRWRAWLADMKKTADGLTEGDKDFQYLRSRFASFEDFARTVTLLRSTAIEGQSNKRWTSKFVFPYGPAALYEDLNIRGSSMTNDRRFFGRVGELVYLMLCRSGRGPRLTELLRPLLLADNSRWNQLLRAFLCGNEDRSVRANAYLPYATLPDYQAFAEDWVSVLECQMPGYDAIPHLVDLLGLHVTLYALRRAQGWVDSARPIHLVLELIAPKRTTIRDLASDTYLANNTLSKQAVEAYVRQVVEESADWKAALGAADPYDAALKVLEAKVSWPDPGDYEGEPTPEALLRSRPGLLEAVRRRHAGHVANVHARYSSAIGLASRRGTRRVRYAPNDRLLKTLVFATVPRRLEFQHFLQELYKRYGFVIGHRQACDFIAQGQADQKAFEDNARRLEMRLASLGLLRRLSDACAYVENPFARRES